MEQSEGDSSSGQSAATSASAALHCPQCGYNLTGLPDNICPECGKTFDPDHLRELNLLAPKPIGLRETLLRLFALPLLFACSGLVARVNSNAGLILAVVTGIALCIGGLINAYLIARRLEVKRRSKLADFWLRRPRVVFMLGTVGGRWCCQIMLAVFGCAAALKVAG